MTTALLAPAARRIIPKASRPPAALTEKRLAMICEKIANGMPMTSAAIAAGVPRRTFQVWLSNGRREDAVEPYKSMADRIEFALAIYHESRVDLVAAGAQTDARLAQWELERRFKDDWGDPRSAGATVNVTIVEQERSTLAERLSEAALEVLGDEPELMERLLARMGLGAVVEGTATEIKELEQ